MRYTLRYPYDMRFPLLAQLVMHSCRSCGCSPTLTSPSAGTMPPRRHGEGAPPYLTLPHSPERLDSHGLALVRGDIIHEKGITRDEVRAWRAMLPVV